MFSNILCDKCHVQKANVTLTKIQNGKAVELHLCQDCASKISPFQKKLAETQQNLGQILASLLGQKKLFDPNTKEETEAPEIPVKNIVCSSCGTSVHLYKKSGFLGCAKCYDEFEEYLITDLRRIHGTTTHFPDKIFPDNEAAGKVTEVTEVKKNYTLEELYDMLDAAVEEERYEDAAKIRDSIKNLKE